MKTITQSNTAPLNPSLWRLLPLTFLVAAAIIFPGCSTTLQKTAAIDDEGQPAIESLNTFDNFQDDDLILSGDPDEPLDQTIDSELEPLVAEEIPLPGPEEAISLESDDTPVGESLLREGKTEIEYDFPITMNRHVEFFLDKFQNSQKETFRKWLERSGRYLPMIQAELQKAGMPLDLAYLPMIESGYRLTAYSRAKATGPWQFMYGTGRFYKLTIDNYVDERRDPIKSTRAAISFLGDLYREFNSWQLAVAAYNAGGGRIRKAIRKTGSDDFWQLIKGSHLNKETKYYVPKLIAAIIIAKDPESYGFEDIEYDEPLAFETLDVPRWTTMQAVALAGDEELEDIHDLNRQLRRAITPPGTKSYKIKVPPGKKELITRNLPRVKATISTSYKTHVIRKGDTVTLICNKYNINKKTLLKANNLRTADLKAGQRLRIPYKTTSYKLVDESMMAAVIGPAEMLPENLIVHKIMPGETISELARKYNAPEHMIAAWNGLENLNHIRAGQQLAFYLKDFESIEDSRLASVSNTLPFPDSNQAPEPEADADDSQASGRLTYYQIRSGDTLWTIARRFQTTPEKIRRWNNIEGDMIRPGRRLLLKTESDIDV